MYEDESLYDLAELFKIFGDSTRVRNLFLILNGEKCVADIADSLSMTQSAISHQLKILKASKLVKVRRDGKQMFYSLDDDHVKSILELGMEHVNE